MSNQKIIWRSSIHLLGLIIFLLGLTACSALSEVFQSDTTEDFYIPPTAAVVSPSLIILTPTSSSTLSAPIQQTLPSPTPSCINDLTFIEDLTIPDQTVVSPGVTLDKRWQVENSGSCNWDESYRVKLVSETNIGTPAEQALYPARSGTQATIRVLFVAPSEPGMYLSAWQAYSPLGEPFGDPFYIDIAVESP